jgi:hypothetical protein
MKQFWVRAHAFEIATWGAGVGLFFLALSPFFKWIDFAAGGVTGLAGTGFVRNGWIVLGTTLIAIAAYATAIIKRQWRIPAILGVQAWGTIAAFWMGGLIWSVSSTFHLSVEDAKDNPFAAFGGALLATQISPGTGLYLGLIGGLIVAGALGFMLVGYLLPAGNLKRYYVAQGVSCVLGIVLAFFAGPTRPSKFGNTRTPDFFPGAGTASVRVAAQSEWRKTHNVSDLQWDELIANFEVRKHVKFDAMKQLNAKMEWWEEAKDKTPAQLNKLYPPLQPHEWYRAEWFGDLSRELDGRNLFLKLAIRTEPDLPIKEVHGHLALVKDGKIIYETQLAEKPEVSFTDITGVFLSIPYDDNNPTHRTLRFAKDKELTPVFTVSKVVLADGIEKNFGK